MKIVVALVVPFAACAPERSKESVLLDARGEAAALWIREVGGGWAFDADLDRVLVAAWEDGTVVWCPDPEVSALRRARVDPARVVEARDRIFETIGRIAPDDRVNAPFDATVTWIAATRDGETLALGSVHERVEANPKLVAVDHGVTTVDARGREGTLAASPPEYLVFREAWSKARATATSLVPADGTPCSVSDYRFEWR